MKQLLLVIVFLCSLTTLQAQDTIKIPTPIAKSIIHDLISGDSAKVELKLTKEVLDSTEKKVIVKDSLITKWQNKYIVCDNNLRNEKTKFELQGQYVTQLEHGKTKLKVVAGFFIFTTIFALLK
jgi:hypothetical protein